VIKDRQTFALQALPVVDGVAQAAIPLDGNLLGTLEVNAYAPLRDVLLSDQRLVLVEPAPAEIAVTADAEVYRPGETATPRPAGDARRRAHARRGRRGNRR
jgi:CD109 antigen